MISGALPPPTSQGLCRQVYTIRRAYSELNYYTYLSLLQYVTEKAGKAGAVTEYDSDYESLCTQLDLIKTATEKMVGFVETIIEPNPSESSVETCVCALGLVDKHRNYEM